MMRKKKEQDRQDQLRWQDLKFYPAYPADVSSILLILFFLMKRKGKKGSFGGFVLKTIGGKDA